jgi:hypothetical protein
MAESHQRLWKRRIEMWHRMMCASLPGSRMRPKDEVAPASSASGMPGAATICGSLAVVMLTLLLGAMTGCHRGAEETPAPEIRPYFLLTIDWDVRNDQDGFPHWVLRSQPSGDAETRFHWSDAFGTREFDGLEYRSVFVFRTEGDPWLLTKDQQVAAVEDPNTHILRVFVRRFEQPDSYIDIHLFCAEPCELSFSHFVGGRLVEADGGKALEKPYWFSPGTYHLQASIPGS